MQDTIKYLTDSISEPTNAVPVIQYIDNTASIFGIPIPLLSVIVVLLTFILGVLINWYNKKKIRYDSLNVIKDTLINWTEQINRSINSKTDLIKDFSFRLKTTEDLHPEHFDINLIMADKLTSFSLKEYTDALVLNLQGDESTNSKNLYNIISQLEFLTKIEPHINDKYEIYHKDSIDLMNKWNDCVFRLNKLKLEMHSDIGKPENNNFEFYSSFSKIWDKQKSFAGNFSVKLFKCEIIEPLIELVTKEIYEKHNQLFTLAIYEVLADLYLIYHKWEVTNRGTASLFESYEQRISDSYKILFDSCEQIKKKKLKKWYKLN